MAQPQNHPLRPLNVQEERELHRIVKASSERIDVEDPPGSCHVCCSITPFRGGSYHGKGALGFV
jgi:hypothetical protein